MLWKTLVVGLAALALAATVMPASAGAQETINPADFSNKLTNPFVSFSALHDLKYEGTIGGDNGETVETSGVMTVLPDEMKMIAGVAVLVVRDEQSEDGELVESTLDYFAQHKDGSVYYFGEDVDKYENGVVVSHEGSWLAGDGENLPGVFMPAEPKKGDVFNQERAPGIAEDTSEVVATGLTVTVPAGTFTGCIETEDFDPLADATESKWYCPGVHLVREEAAEEDEVSELVSYMAAPAATPTAVPPTVAPTPTATAPSGIVAPNTGDGPDGGRALTAMALGLAGALLLAGAATLTLTRRTRI